MWATWTFLRTSLLHKTTLRLQNEPTFGCQGAFGRKCVGADYPKTCPSLRQAPILMTIHQMGWGTLRIWEIEEIIQSPHVANLPMDFIMPISFEPEVWFARFYELVGNQFNQHCKWLGATDMQTQEPLEILTVSSKCQPLDILQDKGIGKPTPDTLYHLGSAEQPHDNDIPISSPKNDWHLYRSLSLYWTLASEDQPSFHSIVCPSYLFSCQWQNRVDMGTRSRRCEPTFRHLNGKM